MQCDDVMMSCLAHTSNSHNSPRFKACMRYRCLPYWSLSWFNLSYNSNRVLGISYHGSFSRALFSTATKWSTKTSRKSNLDERSIEYQPTSVCTKAGHLTTFYWPIWVNQGSKS